MTTTGQPAITASQLRDNVSRGLHHRDRRSVCCCMSACTIVIVDYCMSTDSVQTPYEVILEAYSSRGHRSVSAYHDGGSMCCCMLTGAVQVPSRGHSRGLHQS